jgi:hypothetical protein
MSLLEKRPGRTARKRKPLEGHSFAEVIEDELQVEEDLITITPNALSLCLYCRGGLKKTRDGGTHVSKDGKRFKCSDRPVARPGGW